MEKFLKMRTVIIVTSLAVALFSMPLAAEDFVAMLLPQHFSPRWANQDEPFFVEAMKELSPETKVEVFNAYGDPARQQRQAEQALTRGVKVLVVAAGNGEAAGIIVDSAAEVGVPVIAYDRMIESEHTAFWIQASMFRTGQLQAQHVVDNTKKGDTLVLLKGSPTDPNAVVIAQGQEEVLRPLFDSGERILGYENWTPNWDTAIARRSMDQALTKLNNNVQGVVASNDGSAAAVVSALDEQGLVGSVPVSGLDASIQALQLILLGEQTQTVWRPFHEMARIAAELSVRLLNNESTDSLTSGTVKNSLGADIPFVPVAEYSAVGEEGVAYVIEHDPAISKADVCQGDAAQTSFCRS